MLAVALIDLFLLPISFCNFFLHIKYIQFKKKSNSVKQVHIPI